MRLLALSGQRSAALAQYESCCQRLKEELDVEPDQETTWLYEQIRDGKIKGVARKKAVPHNLPAILSRFVGRERELRELKIRLEDPDRRLLTLVGPGGCGKTRLAIEAAHRQIGRFKQGVYLVPLAGVQTPHMIPQAIGAALSFSFRSEGEPWGQLLDYLRRKQVLLVMDNCEHLVAGMGMLVELLHSAPDLKILATSRIRLNVLDENLLPLSGMAYPEDLVQESQTTALACYSAVQLFLEGAGRVKPEFEPNERDLHQIGTICRLVGGMPLAVLLSASWSGLLNPTEIAAQIRQDSLDFLETEWGDVPERHRSMRHVFEHSWNLLSAAQQEILAGLSVFPGSFNFPAAQSVTGLDLKALRGLVNRSVVETSSTERFELHPLMRQYATEKLAALSGLEETYRARHCVFFTEKLAWWGEQLQGSGQLEAQQEIAVEIENIRQAWDWALEHQKFDCLSGALDGLGGMYDRLCLYREGEVVFEKSVEHMQKALKDGLDRSFIPLLARMLGWQSVFNGMLGNYEIASHAIAAGFDLLQNQPFQPLVLDKEQAFLYHQRGILMLDSDRVQSQRDFQASLEIYQRLENRWLQASVLNSLAGIAFSQGQYRKAIDLNEEGLAIYRDLGDTVGVATSLIQLCINLSALRDFEKMDEFVHEYAIRLRNLGSPSLLADYLTRDAMNQVYRGRYAEAYERMQGAIEIYDDLGDQRNCENLGELLSWIIINQGFYDRVYERVQASIDLARQQDNKNLIAMGYLGLGEIDLARGMYQQARKNLNESISNYRQVIQRDDLSITLVNLADAENSLGLHQQKKAHFREALQIARETGGWQACLFVVGRGALFAVMQGEVEKGVELYALATRYPYVGNSVFWEDTVGRHIKERAAELPEEVIIAAQERGQKRELQETVKELLEDYSLSQ
jgi:predicted ATPase